MKLFVLLFIFSVPFLSLSQVSSPVFNWKAQEISKDNNLQSMGVHDSNTGVIAGYGKTFKMTTDKGLTWKDVGLLNPKYNFNDLSINGNVGYIVARKTLLVDNTTGGEDDVYANGVLLKTIDGGNTWSTVPLSKIGEGTNPALNPSMAGSISLNPFSVLSISDTKAMMFLQWYEVISGVRKTHSAVFKTSNGGDKWTAITKDFGAAYINTIKMNGTDIFIGGNKILLKASSENETVTDLFPAFSAVAGNTAFINEIRFYQSNEIYVVTITGIYNSNDNGATFTKLTGPSGGNDFFKLDANVMIVLGTTAASKATINGGATWVNSSPGKTCYEIGGVFNDSLYALAAPAVYKMAVSDFKSGNYKWVAKILAEGSTNLQKMFRFDANKALILGDDQIAKKTTDKGITWTNAAFPDMYIYDGKYDFCSVSAAGNAGFASSHRLMAADFATREDYYLSGLIYKTTDAWKTWKLINNKNVGKDSPTDASKYPTLTGCYGMDNYTVECVDANTAYLYAGWSDTVSVPKTVTKHSRVFKTTDGGDSWSAITKDFGSAIVNSIKFSGQTGYVGGNKILLKTIDGGKTFTDLYPKLTVGTDSNLFVSAVNILNTNMLCVTTSNDNKGIFLTKDGGATFTKLTGATTGLDFVALNNNSFMAVGATTDTKFTNDGGANWKDCNPGATLYAAGKVLNDSLYVLGRSNVYKIAVSGLDIRNAVAELASPAQLKVLYGSSALEVVSTDRNIDRCMLYGITGQLVAIAEPHSRFIRFEYNLFKPGIYIVAAVIEGKKYTQKVILK